MKYIRENEYLLISLSPIELWYLAKLFAPGLLFGVEDISEGLSESEVSNLENKAYSSLQNAGMIEYSDKNELIVDELLGAILYSCIHSKDLLIINDEIENEKKYYYFLPDWHVELNEIGEGYQLKLFDDRTVFLNNLEKGWNLNCKENDKKTEFFIRSRDLQGVIFLYESGKEEKAIKYFVESIKGKIPYEKEFLAGYIGSAFHLTFDIIYDRDQKDLMSNAQYEIIKVGEGLYWFSHWPSSFDEDDVLYIQNVPLEQVRENLNEILP